MIGAASPITRPKEPLRLAQGESVTVVPRPPLGDGLVSLVLARNLAAAGARVEVLHDQLAYLAGWAPRGVVLQRRGAAGEGAPSVVVHHAPDSLSVAQGSRATFILREHAELHRHAPRAEVLRDLGASLFHLEEPGSSYALEIPGRLSAEEAGNPRRVLLHPESGEPARSWPADSFLALGAELRERGLEPELLVAPSELSRWEEPAQKSGLPVFCEQDLALAAQRLATSRMLVGNDSGVGHLAAAIGTPCVVLFTRRRVAERWCPRGGPVEPVLPPLEVPITALQRRLWKRTIGVPRVLGAIERLLQRSE